MTLDKEEEKTLREELTYLRACFKDLADANARLNGRVERMREALAEIADWANWNHGEWWGGNTKPWDIARAALEEERESDA